MTKHCERCGLSEHDTPEGMLAYHGSRLVCADCDSDLTNEDCADNGTLHPLDTFCPVAHVAQRYR
jgi:hypothetical protein